MTPQYSSGPGWQPGYWLGWHYDLQSEFCYIILHCIDTPIILKLGQPCKQIAEVANKHNVSQLVSVSSTCIPGRWQSAVAATTQGLRLEQGCTTPDSPAASYCTAVQLSDTCIPDLGQTDNDWPQIHQQVLKTVDEVATARQLDASQTAELHSCLHKAALRWWHSRCNIFLI